MTDQPAMQTITLDNPATLCVFDSEGNPFYSVAGMATMLTGSLITKTMSLDESSTDSDRAYVLGQIDLVEHISKQADSLKGTYQVANVSTVEDLLRFSNGDLD